MKPIVLVTGGLGYLGGRLSKFLVTTTDYRLRVAVHKKLDNIPEWLKGVELVKMDLLEQAEVAAACMGVDTVIHLAALNEIICAKNPEQALLVNGLGTLRLLQVAEKAGVKKFIYLSTAHVYGPLVGKVTESTLPKPTHPYAITHKVAEDFVLASKQLTGIVLRLSNGIGAPVDPEVDRWTLLVNDLAKQIVTTGKIKLLSTGTQYRDFISLEDFCKAVLHFINLSPKACDDGLFNVGGDCSLTVFEMAKMLVKVCERSLGFSPTICRPESTIEGSAKKLSYCIDKLISTNFMPKKNIELELEGILKFCNKHFGTN